MKEPETLGELRNLGEEVLRIMRETRSLDKHDHASNRNTEILANVGMLLRYGHIDQLNNIINRKD